MKGQKSERIEPLLIKVETEGSQYENELKLIQEGLDEFTGILKE
jgi:hypothetical protein